MADAFQSVKGLREMGEAMRRLTEAVNNKISGRATNAGAQVIKTLAKQKAPVASEPYRSEKVTVPPGNIGRNVIVKKIPKGQTNLTSEHIVTVRSKGAGVIGHPYRTAIFNEFGTVKMDPKAFMRPAFDGGKSSAVDAITHELASGIEAEANK